MLRDLFNFFAMGLIAISAIGLIQNLEASRNHAEAQINVGVEERWGVCGGNFNVCTECVPGTPVSTVGGWIISGGSAGCTVPAAYNDDCVGWFGTCTWQDYKCGFIRIPVLKFPNGQTNPPVTECDTDGTSNPCQAGC